MGERIVMVAVLRTLEPGSKSTSGLLEFLRDTGYEGERWLPAPEELDCLLEAMETLAEPLDGLFTREVGAVGEVRL